MNGMEEAEGEHEKARGPLCAEGQGQQGVWVRDVSNAQTHSPECSFWP